MPFHVGHEWNSFWMEYITRFKWILRKPQSWPFLTLSYGRITDASKHGPRRRAALRRLHLAGNYKGRPKGKKKKTCNSRALRLWKRHWQAQAVNVDHSQQETPLTDGNVTGSGRSGSWLQGATAGLTVLSDAHSQKALWFLDPLKYLISEVYEALQENEEDVRTNALLRRRAECAVLLRELCLSGYTPCRMKGPFSPPAAPGPELKTAAREAVRPPLVQGSLGVLPSSNIPRGQLRLPVRCGGHCPPHSSCPCPALHLGPKSNF